MKRSFLAWILVLAATGVQSAAAQNEVVTPRSYALTNARIVVSPGNIIELGTVVIRDGRITAAGANAQVPAGVIPLDLGGATVYAGLIDVANGAGLPAIAAGGRGGGGGAEPMPSGPPPELNPGLNAADAFTPGAGLLANYRAAGVTTVGLAFNGGIFPGRVSAVSTREGTPSSLVVRSPVAQQVAFGRKRGGYPGTLMGVLAYIEQSFKDARHDARLKAAFERSPGTSPLPPYDSEHEALQPAASGTLPVWFAASGAYDIERAIDLAAQLGIEEYTIVGGQEAFKVASQVRETGRTVIVSLDFPNPNQMTGRSFELHVEPVSGEDTAAEQADSAAARTLRGNAAALAAAGVPFAFSGMGLSTPAEFRRRVVALVDEGLSPDAALGALTVTPAAVLGLGAAMGTVETGKIANLVVVSGDLFDEDAGILHVFVQGEKYDIPPPAVASGRGGRGGGAGGGGGMAMAAGEWSGSIDMQGQVLPFTLTITGQNDALSATLGTEMGSTALRGDMAEGRLTLNGVFDSPNGQLALLVNAVIEGNEMTGTVDVQGMGSVSLTARRPGAMGRTNATMDGGNR